LQGLPIQIEVSKIIAYEADEPNAVVDLLDPEFLASQHSGVVDPLAMQAGAATGGDANLAIRGTDVSVPARNRKGMARPSRVPGA
jgi:hypothetical protein